MTDLMLDAPLSDGAMAGEGTVAAAEFKPGELAPSIVTSSKVWKPANFKDATLIATLKSLAKDSANAHTAAQRYAVLETWEARLMDRGQQYLQSGVDGRWSIVGGNEKNPINHADDSNLYATNIFSSQGDIATGALSRAKIKVSFSPKRSKNPSDASGAEEANRYLPLWEKKNAHLQRDIMNIGWTDCRVLVWTRSIADRRFGMDGDTPQTFELSTAHGTLETRLPMLCDRLDDCNAASIYEEVDYALARASYPWVKDKIKPASGGGDQDFERIARVNTRVGVAGKQGVLTGSTARETTMSYHWLRPGMYFDDKVTDAQRDFLLGNFGDGIFVILAAGEFCCCWEESMDDHLALGMYTRGFGQNRRALGSSDIPIQKRVNIWADLWDRFVRTAIPITALDTDAWNAEAIASLEASPRRFVPVTPPDGKTIDGTYGQTPSPSPIAGMLEMFQWYCGPLIQAIDGATPALAGGGEGVDNTVGATQIRLQQALERYGPTWAMANSLFAMAATQAARCCGQNGVGALEDTVPGVGDVKVDPSKLKGSFEATAETMGAIPESGAQRQAKIMSVLDMAKSSAEIASLVSKPSNAREFVRGLQLDDVLTIDEANSEDKQLEEIGLLLETKPLQNPAWHSLSEQLAQLSDAHDGAKQSALSSVAQGIHPGETAISSGEALEQQIQALTQKLQTTPQYVSYLAVAEDDSEDHATEAATLFAWMQGVDGRTIRRKAAAEGPSGANWAKWTNNYLHWQAHKAQAEKYANKPSMPISGNVKITATPDQAAQLLQSAGGITTPQGSNGMVPHEIVQKQEGVDSNGVKTTREVSIAGKGLE